jgi:hypothetical protein
MGVRPFGSGFDPNSGWPADDSTGVPWDSDVDLSGYGRFGPGGFAPNPKLTGPASGPPPGMSLSGPGGNAGGGQPIIPDEVMPPEYSTIPNNKSVGPFTGGSATDAIIRGGMRMLPRILRGRIPLADIVAPTDELGGATGVELPRTLGRSPTGPMGPGLTRGPVPVSPPATPFTQPQHPSTMRYPMWPSGSAPPAAAPMPARPVTPTPATAYGFPTPPVRPAPRAPAPAGPAAARQQPNLGSYMMDRPNMPAGQQGGRGGPSQTQMGVFGWDPNGPLFGRG